MFVIDWYIKSYKYHVKNNTYICMFGVFVFVLIICKENQHTIQYYPYMIHDIFQ